MTPAIFRLNQESHIRRVRLRRCVIHWLVYSKCPLPNFWMSEVLNVRKWKSSGPYPSPIVTTSSHNLNTPCGRFTLHADRQVDAESFLRESRKKNEFSRVFERTERTFRTFRTNERIDGTHLSNTVFEFSRGFHRGIASLFKRSTARDLTMSLSSISRHSERLRELRRVSLSGIRVVESFSESFRYSKCLYEYFHTCKTSFSVLQDHTRQRIDRLQHYQELRRVF